MNDRPLTGDSRVGQFELRSVLKLLSRVKAKIATKTTSKRGDFESLPGCLPDCPDCRWLRAHEERLKAHGGPVGPSTDGTVDGKKVLSSKGIVGVLDISELQGHRSPPSEMIWCDANLAFYE
jgi:hypothetical protein